MTKSLPSLGSRQLTVTRSPNWKLWLMRDWSKRIKNANQKLTRHCQVLASSYVKYQWRKSREHRERHSDSERQSVCGSQSGCDSKDAEVRVSRAPLSDKETKAAVKSRIAEIGKLAAEFWQSNVRRVWRLSGGRVRKLFQRCYKLLSGVNGGWRKSHKKNVDVMRDDTL